jgi:hypothetical protein
MKKMPHSAYHKQSAQTTDKKKLLQAARENRHIIYWGIKIRMDQISPKNASEKIVEQHL